jgi:serine/threonine-protein kinase RsbW
MRLGKNRLTLAGQGGSEEWQQDFLRKSRTTGVVVTETAGSAWTGEADTQAIRLTIPAKAEYITLGRLALTGLSRLRPLSEETLADLKLALTEACSNSVRHAYGAGEGAVEIVYELHEDRVAIEVTDEGEGFGDARAAAAGDDLVEGGLGIAIIKAIADEFESGPGDGGHGSRLRFVKLLPEPSR